MSAPFARGLTFWEGKGGEHCPRTAGIALGACELLGGSGRGMGPGRPADPPVDNPNLGAAATESRSLPARPRLSRPLGPQRGHPRSPSSREGRRQGRGRQAPARGSAVDGPGCGRVCGAREPGSRLRRDGGQAPDFTDALFLLDPKWLAARLTGPPPRAPPL